MQVELPGNGLESGRASKLLLIVGHEQRNPKEGAIELVKSCSVGGFGEHLIVELSDEQRLARLEMPTDVVDHTRFSFSLGF